MKTGLKLRFWIFVALFVTTACSAYIAVKEGRGEKLTVAFLDVGQGDAIFIESPNGNQMLLDAGPGKSVLRELSKIMPFYDRSIDVLLATHPDADHIGGMPDVLEKYKVSLFLEPGVEGDTSLYKELELQIEKRESQGKIEKLEARRGMVVDLGSGAILEILFPAIDPEGMETNTASIVARLVYGASEFLLTGDSPSNIEDYLVSQNCTETNCAFGLDADVLKAGHHGSKTSTSREFVSTVSPEYAIISAGKDNRYGHPHPEVLETLTTTGAKILRTDTSGRIIFESDGVNLEVR